MKGKRCFLAILVVMLLFVCQSLVFGEGYLLRCKGGAVRIDGATNFSITLSKAPSHTNVQQGQCAWMDRILSPTENPILFCSVGKIHTLRLRFTSTIGGGEDRFNADCHFTFDSPIANKLARAALSQNEYLVMVKAAEWGLMILQNQPYL